MSVKPEQLQAALTVVLGDKLAKLIVDRGQIIVEVSAENYLAAAMILRDDAALDFSQLIDLCGVDYSGWGEGATTETSFPGRFAATSQLLSIHHNWRVHHHSSDRRHCCKKAQDVQTSFDRKNAYERLYKMNCLVGYIA